MPRIRKNLADQEEAITNYKDLERETNSADFLKDPDLFKDPLPQPYRRIDKILQELLDDVWNILDKKDIVKKIEASKPRPNKWSGSILEDVKDFNCMCASSDEANEYVFLGSSSGVLYCVDAARMRVVVEFELGHHENANIISICSSQIKDSTHFVVCLSDTGCIFMNVLMGAKFFPVQSPIDVSSMTERRVRKIEISKNCDYFAALLDSKNETWIDVYKCPRESWLQSVEDFRKTPNPHLNESSELDLNETEATPKPSTAELTKPTLACRIKPSLNQIKFPTAPNNLNAAQSFKSVEVNGDFIGVGVNNCMSRVYLDVKNQFFEKIFDVRLDEDSIVQINGSKNYDAKITADFKFLPPNRLIPSTDQQELPNCLIVNWNGSNQMLFYPLAKANKELESKFEYTISFAAPIEQIDLTKCNIRMAFVLKNSNLVVFNLNSGLGSCCDVNLYPNESFKQAFFLPSSTDWNEPTTTTQLNVISRLAALTSRGRVYAIFSNDCTNYGKCLFEPQLANRDDEIESIMPFKNLPNLILTVSVTGKIFILDIEKGKLICELSSNAGESKISGKEISYNSKNFQLFLKVKKKNEIKSALVCHSLRLVSPLDDYLSTNFNVLNTCLPTNGLLIERMATLMKYRMEEEAIRKQRLNNIWDELGKFRNY